MMFDTPIPPTMRVSTPMMPRKALKESMKMSKNWNCSVVSHIDIASLSFASKRRRLPNAALTPSMTALVSPEFAA
jgi:hypothetical protein